MGLLDGVRVERSSVPQFRARAAAVSDYFVDQPYEGEIVRARYRDGKLLLHKGGDRFLEIPEANSVRNKSARLETRVSFGCNQ